MYYDGQGVDKNMKEAFKWFKRAASWKLLNFPKALYYVGFMYANGQGVDKNMEKAFKWYKRAAAMDDGDSMYEVAYMYANGQGVKKDTDKALKWLNRAKRHPDATYKELQYKNESLLRRLDESQKQFHGDNYDNVIDEHDMPIPKPPQLTP
jgi:TPR repeat protein